MKVCPHRHSLTRTGRVGAENRLEEYSAAQCVEDCGIIRATGEQKSNRAESASQKAGWLSELRADVVGLILVQGGGYDGYFLEPFKKWATRRTPPSQSQTFHDTEE